MSRQITGAQAGLSGEEQIHIALKEIVDKGGVVQMSELYTAVEQHMKGARLSDQGKATLRRLINTTAVQAGYVYPHDPDNPGWQITPEGREFFSREAPVEEVVNVDTGRTERLPSNTVRGAAFERAVLVLMRKNYPHYAWYHQGQHKSTERGLDLIGTRVGEDTSGYKCLGVQAKCHSSHSAPSKEEWLKFLAGCFVRQVDQAIFVTTGRLSPEQRREAGEGSVIVIEGISTIRDLCQTYGIDYTIFEDLFQSDIAD